MLRKIKNLIRVVLAGFLYYSYLLTLRSLIRGTVYPNTNSVLLTYHRIAADEDRLLSLTQPGMYVTRGNFESQMKFLSEHYNMVSLNDLAELIINGKSIPKKSVTVTFDDGWGDNYDRAFPILQKYNVPAIIFLPTDLIETNKITEFIELCLMLGEEDLWPNKAINVFAEYINEQNADQLPGAIEKFDFSELKKDAGEFMRTILSLGDEHIKALNKVMKTKGGLDIDKWEATKWMLNWDEIREMLVGGIDFGAHTKSHRILTSLSPAEIKMELTESKKIIEEKIDKPVLFFAYPNSSCSPEIMKLVKESNYMAAVSGRHSKSDDKNLNLFAIRRINMNEGAVVGYTGKFSKALFACRLAGIFKQ